jgi:nitrite reductase/ring-hydroxylating ferredoxin subunit
VPGFIDYLYTVPPRSTGKQRATRHMIVNLAAVIVVLIAWIARRQMVDGPNALVLGLELGALVLLTAGGWMGGVLVSRNQISVDHRYAGAGKWKDATIAASGNGPLVVASEDELKVDQMKLLRVSGQRLVLARSEKGYVAFDDRCPHRGGSLAGGSMMCGTVQCPWHGSQFDVSSGAMKTGPADGGIRTYQVEVVNGDVRLLL